jgi:N-acetylglucosamine-6-phosphate deacetylase
MDDVAGYFDLQVNGYGGVSFQDESLSGEDLHRACSKMRADGVGGFLTTITTSQVETMCRRLRRVVELRDADPLAREMIWGIHIEGPFLSPVDGYRGAHLKEACRPTDAEAMRNMLDAAGGLTRIVTLAPEVDAGFAVTKMLAGMDIRVSAGHTNATLDELKAAIDAGLSMFTHVGNGCPMQMHRHDNIVQRALSVSDRLWMMFIADGAHVAFPALKNYLKIAGIERSIVVTDATSPAGMGPGRYQYGRWDLQIGEDLVAWSPDRSHLVGSVLPMSNAVERLVTKVGLSREQALRLTADNPRAALGYQTAAGGLERSKRN